MDASRMSFGDHLEELRWRLVICLIAIALAMIVSFIFYSPVLRFFVEPYERVRAAVNAASGEEVLGRLKLLSVPEGIFAAMKASMIVAVAIAGPVLLYQMWQFIAAGLYAKERHSVLFYLPLSVVLFACGMVFGYLVMVPFALQFLLNFLDPANFESTLTLSNYLSFLLTMTFLLGLVFQIPMIMLFLSRTGMVEPKFLASKRKIFIFSAFVVGAFLTPPDPVTQLLMAGPIIVLFEIGLLLARAGWRKHREAVDSPD